MNNINRMLAAHDGGNFLLRKDYEETHSVEAMRRDVKSYKIYQGKSFFEGIKMRFCEYVPPRRNYEFAKDFLGGH